MSDQELPFSGSEGAPVQFLIPGTTRERVQVILTSSRLTARRAVWDSGCRELCTRCPKRPRKRPEVSSGTGRAQIGSCRTRGAQPSESVLSTAHAEQVHGR